MLVNQDVVFLIFLTHHGSLKFEIVFCYRVNENCPRLLINREKCGEKNGIWGMSSGFDFDSKHNTRDVAWLGDCDEGCQLFAEKLGWGVSIYFTYQTKLNQ